MTKHERGAATQRKAAEAGEPGVAKIARGAEYLRENVKYAFGEREQAGLRRFYELAVELGIVLAPVQLAFYGQG